MDKSFKIISSLFLIGGMGIIVAAFFLFLKDCQKENLFYLNIVACCIIYAVAFLRTFDIFGTVGHVAGSSSGYGLKWYAVWLYVPAAAALVILSIAFGWQFSYCLAGHVILLFILLMFFFLGDVIRKNVNASSADIEARKAGLKDIADRISLLEISCRTGNGEAYLENVSALREAVRYITASDNAVACSLEDPLSSKIQLIADQIEHSSQAADMINAEFKECMALVELRKRQY